MTAKSVVISAAGLFANICSGVAIWTLVTHGATLPWVGVALVHLPPALGLAYIFVRQSVSRTSANLPAFIGAAVVGTALTLAPLVGPGDLDRLALGLAVAGLVGVLLYVRWYSVFGRTPSDAIAVGKALPGFTLQDADGQEVRSRDFGGPAVLLFYRGNWCPLCMAQIKEIAGLYRQLDERGVSVKLISPQPEGHTRALARRFDVAFDFLVDPGNAAARRLGIASPDPIPAGMTLQGYDAETVMPTVIITDADGTIIFCDQSDNYRVRPEPETFLRVLDAHAAGA